jgi:hypothetical protein
MATKEAKAEQKAIKAEAKKERNELKALEKAERKETQTRSKVARKKLQSQLKDQKKPAKTARKEIRKEMSRIAAVQKVRKLPQRFGGTNIWVRLIMVLLAYSWMRSNWEKERQERDIREARRFLRKLHCADCD